MADRCEMEPMRMFAVVMAGGGGTRLWPKSRERMPKQMHALIGDKPLVQETTERLQAIVGDDRVFIVANGHHATAIEAVMPEMNGKIIVDPYRRDTAPCIGLAAAYLSRIDPDGVMGVFPSDPYIGSVERFEHMVRAACVLASRGRVVTIGVTPTGPETGYGYIETDGPADLVDGVQAFDVKRFVEKPSREKAEEYLAQGGYLWNSGMFVWSIRTVLSLYREHLPEMYERLMRIREAIGTQDEESVLKREYEGMQKISVDYGIMEQVRDILVLPGDFDWNDIGNWATISELSPKDENGNVVHGEHLGVATRNCLVQGDSGRLIATIGVEDLIIVDTDDALLICRKECAQDVKKIVDKLKDREMHDYL